MNRREFVKGIFIVGAAAAIPHIVLSDTIPDFGTKIGEVAWNTTYVTEKSSWLHMASIEMGGSTWATAEYAEGSRVTPEMEKVMLDSLKDRWIQLHDA